jgi:co-chaperonin GroES (HSP10)
MRAVNNFIIISETVEEKKTDSGLLLTIDESEEMRYGKGVVVEAGDKVSVVKKGDTIYFDKRQGHQVRLEGTLYGIIREPDVVVIM